LGAFRLRRFRAGGRPVGECYHQRFTEKMKPNAAP
jgi:hypothetical protein